MLFLSPVYIDVCVCSINYLRYVVCAFEAFVRFDSQPWNAAFYCRCSICIQTPVSDITAHSEVRICLTMLTAMRSAGYCAVPLTPVSSSQLAGQTLQATTTPWYGTIFTTRRIPLDSKLSSFSVTNLDLWFNCRCCTVCILTELVKNLQRLNV